MTNKKNTIITSQAKKIAFVGNSSFSIYNFRLGVMKSFVEKGFDVYAIAPKDQYSDFFGQESIKYINLDIDGKSTNLIKEIKLFFKIFRLYKKHKFDFIFHYTIKPVIYGSFVCRLLNIPTIAITTGLGYTFYKENSLNKLVLLLYKSSLKKTKEVWFLNNDDRNIFISKKLIQKSHSFVLNSEGIDSSFFSPKKKTEESSSFNFLFLSRLVKEKGIVEYVEAAKKLKNKYPEVQCIVLGKTDIENPSNLPLEKILEWGSKGYIKYVGSTTDVREYIANCDCVVLPSYYREGVPRCLMEGMSMEKPIITTNNVGCVELIKDGINGFICEIKDVDDLTEKMEKMFLLDKEKLSGMGINGRKLIIEKFDEINIIDIYAQKLHQFLQ